MEEVEVGVALGAGVVVVVIASALFKRRGSREAQSVAGYRQTLDVLGHLGGSERDVRLHESPEPGAARARRYERPKGAEAASSDEIGAESAHRHSITALGGPSKRRDRSLLVMERPARRLGGSLAALVLVLAAGGAVAYVVVRAHRVTHPSKQSAASHSHSGSRSHGHSTPPTTAPPRYTAATSTGSSATYVPATTSYSLTIGATTADCWMSVTSASGTTLLAQTFAPGASATIRSLTGRSTIILGAPRSADVSIDGVPVVLPSGIAGPYTVTLTPS